MTHEEFARLAGVPAPSVSFWLSAKRKPGLKSAFRIQTATGGAVDATDWLDQSDRAA